MKKQVLLLCIILMASCADKNVRLLDFPATRQAYEFSCGPGAVQAVMAYYGVDFRESELINLLKTEKDEGTYVKDIVKFFHYQGFSTEVKHKMTMGELFSYIDHKIPVIVLIQAWGTESEFENKYKDCWNAGHFAIVIGYSDKNVYISDPALYNAGYIPVDEFIDRWHDYDEGETKTYQLGIAIFGKKPLFNRDIPERIR